MRRIVYTVVAGLLLLTVAIRIVSHLSYRHAIVSSYHDKEGTQWEVGTRDGQFAWENEFGVFERQIHPMAQELQSLEQQMAPDLQRVNQAEAEWRQASDHSEQNRLRVLEQILEADRRLRDPSRKRSELGIRLQATVLQFEKLHGILGRRGPAPIAHTVRCDVAAEVTGATAVFIWIGWLTGTVLCRRHRRRSGRCIRCGYDLRASANCCPECGLPIAVGRTAESAQQIAKRAASI